MEGAAKKIEALISTGEGFSYGNFAVLEPQRRWAASLKPEWVSWVTRVEGAIRALFSEDSAPVRLLQQARKKELLGNGPDVFNAVMGFYMGALHSARDVLQEDTFGEIAGSATKGPMASSNRVFVVHGHDEKSKSELEIILSEMGLEPVVLHRQADGGRTLIEKFEHYADVGYAFVMLTPDEVAYLVSEEVKSDNERNKEYRARPNAIFESGFFVGRLGRGRTCCIYRSPVTLPSDLDGLIYKQFRRSVEEVAYAIGKELKAAGYQIR